MEILTPASPSDLPPLGELVALEAGIDIKIVSEQLGHSTTRITQDLYQHVRHQVHADSAEKVVALLPGLKGAKATGI